MSHTLGERRADGQRDTTPVAALDAASIQNAYRRWAGVYDAVFGGVSSFGRKRAAALVNSLPGRDVLEVGVGTGLALPCYGAEKIITGIDLSAEMLEQARKKVSGLGLSNVGGLLEMDAEATSFADDSFDSAVAMFVASVVPNPRLLLTEMRRVVRPGGHILFVNHFAAARGPRWWVERAMAPASRALGWHPDFAMEALLEPDDMARMRTWPIQPFGIFTLVELRN